MYERSAIVLEKYFNKVFGFNESNNLKKLYNSYKTIIEETCKYQEIIEEEEKVIEQFDQIANEIRSIQQEQKKLYKSNIKLEEDRNKLFDDLDEEPALLEKKLEKIGQTILSNNERLEELKNGFINSLKEFNERQKERNKCSKSRRLEESAHIQLIEEVRKELQEIDVSGIKELKQFATAETLDDMKKEIAEGRQVYVICPMVEESEGLEAENVLDYTKRLRQEMPPEISVGFLHGRMKPAEKNKIMEEFSENKIQILVSTTVIEVGVNVPNATVMMVENAERFGLAQLHQLRGRVGRGEHQSYCIFMQGGEKKEIKERLQILVESNDGFFIAGEDLRLRGPGDLFGIRQSGILEFKLADIYQDAAILKEASIVADEILEKDPHLESEEYKGLKNRLEFYAKEQMKRPGI